MKLTEEDKADIRARLARKETGHSIALLYGVGDPVISQVKTGNVNIAHTPERRAEHRSLKSEERHSYDKRWRAALKLEVFTVYGGPRCALCPESRIGALHLDHIAQDGSHHRRSIGIPTGPLYRWVKKNGFPDGFRVLCSNCNLLAYHDSRTQFSQKRSAISKRKRAPEIKAELMGKLGGRCKVCKTSDVRVLSIHHPGYDGKSHRKTVSGGHGSHKFYIAVLKSGSLEGLECLCMSCNDADACG